MLDDLRIDIEKLISAYESVKAENVRISAELEKKEAQLEACKKQIIELDKQIDNIQLRNAFLATPGDAGAKVKIERLIRDIDKCIELMERNYGEENHHTDTE